MSVGFECGEGRSLVKDHDEGTSVQELLKRRDEEIAAMRTQLESVTEEVREHLTPTKTKSQRFTSS